QGCLSLHLWRRDDEACVHTPTINSRHSLADRRGEERGHGAHIFYAVVNGNDSNIHCHCHRLTIILCQIRMSLLHSLLRMLLSLQLYTSVSIDSQKPIFID